MNKKGFTLIELLVVVILIVAIVLLVLPNITNSVKNYNTNVDKTTFNIIKEATKLYISDNTNSFMKRSENAYCVSLNTLIDEDYLKNTIEYNNKDITHTKVVKVTYDNGFNYELVNKNDCERVVKFNTICEVDKEQLYATNELDKGYKYNCKVDPDKPRYNFYVLSYNDENGNITFDKETAKSVNLIMAQNINSDGTPTTKAILESEKEENSGIYNLVAYNASGDASETGPETAITYLNNATSSWENIDNLNLIYDDEGKNFVGFSINGKARMPYHSEVGDSNGTNEYLYENLDGYDWCGMEGKQPTSNISEIYGYWTLSSYDDNSTRAWYVNQAGYVLIDGADYVGLSNAYGVRPVITLEL